MYKLSLSVKNAHDRVSHAVGGWIMILCWKMMVRIIEAPRQKHCYGVVAKQFELVVTIGTVVGNPLCVCTVRVH
jgi:hypothetical protein